MVNPTGYTALDLIGFTDKGTYSSSDNYVKNDLVHYSGNIWRCLFDDTTGISPAEGVNWTLFIGEPTNLVERIIAPVETDPATSAWAVGRQIIFNDNLYEVIAAITAGDALVAYEDDPTNANIKLADPVETQLLNVKGNLTNRNLLDNAWFTVNQRGQASYSESGQYTVDRWKSWSTTTNARITVNADKSLTLEKDGTADTFQLFQYIEQELFNSLLGKTVTLSILLNNGTLLSKSGIVENTNKAFINIPIDSGLACQLDFTKTSASIFVRLISWSGSTQAGSITVKAVKLELGSVSTLAQDTAPNYAEELLKCQRYYYRFYNAKQNNSPNFHGYLTQINTAVAAVDLPVPMRALPSITSTCKFRVMSFEGIVVADKTPSSYSLAPLNPSHLGDVKQISMILSFAAADSTATKSLVPVDVVPLGSDSDSDKYVEFSAEL